MKIDLTREWENRTKYGKCVTYLMNDSCPLRSLRNRLMALQAITEKVAPNATFTSKEIGAAPMALATLCIHQDGDFWSGFAPIKVVEQKECFINLYDNKYLKVYYNVYKLQWTLEEIKDFVNAVCEFYGIVLGN